MNDNIESLRGKVRHLPDCVGSNSWTHKNVSKSLDGLLSSSPDYYDPIQELVEVGLRGGWQSRGLGGSFRPMEGVLHDLKTDRSRIEHLTSALLRREKLLALMRSHSSDFRFRVQLGDQTPYELCLDTDVHLGGNRFYLMSGEKYDGNARPVFGMIDFDYNGRQLVVSTIQDHGYGAIIEKDGFVNTNPYNEEGDDEVRDNLEQGIVRKDGKERKLHTIISKGQKRIKEAVKKNRVLKLDPHGRETQGVEELLIYSTAHILRQIGIFEEEDATILIPNPQETPWGSPYTENVGSATAIDEAINRSLMIAMDNLPLLSKKRLVRDLGNIGELATLVDFDEDSGQISAPLVDITRISQRDRRLKRNPLTINLRGEPLQWLGTYVAKLLLGEVPIDLRPSDQELTEYGLYDDFAYDSEPSFVRFIRYIATLTPAYMTTMHAYRTAFAEVKGEEVPMGRNISLDEITKLPFIQRLKIESL